MECSGKLAKSSMNYNMRIWEYFWVTYRVILWKLFFLIIISLQELLDKTHWFHACSKICPALLTLHPCTQMLFCCCDRLSALQLRFLFSRCLWTEAAWSWKAGCLSKCKQPRSLSTSWGNLTTIKGCNDINTRFGVKALQHLNVKSSSHTGRPYFWIERERKKLPGAIMRLHFKRKKQNKKKQLP